MKIIELNRLAGNFKVCYKERKSESESESFSHDQLCDPMDYTVHGILQVRILEGVAFPFSRASSQSRNQTRVSFIAGRFFNN